MVQPTVADAQFEAQRGRLFSIAYRVLGRASDAEDAVQDAYLRWCRAAEVRDPEAYLVRVVTRLAVDRLRSAHARREVYVGPWLPEPLLTGPGTAEPLQTVEQRESVSFAVLLLLERLSPTERAVFVLRAVFDRGYAELAEMLDITPDYCRQLYSRARSHLAEERRRFPADRRLHADLTRRLLAAASGGDLTGLEAMLCEDAVVITDGGGRVRAALRPVVGRAAVARFLLGISPPEPFSVEMALVEVNGAPGLIATDAGRLTSVGLVEAEDGRARRIYVVVNPDKLRW
ncbi:MAG TPA: RNA polymerase sigma-70 factor, partial [Pilimelia sp.]|nr:RNA polymerase sigma-70 factor [Pilimelia sp.]